ncbi:polysaccharide pyruvyl transferase family protein, partial [Candidatus Enterococcus testudinis]|uniref:polysaccharide pyruvyl transferase family protein n=1 Tax=Candidatus Enterococcus testudinis TaxID=1834191 RepID=UPI0015C50E56
MKKVLLCGATHGSNFGDTIFAYMFYSYLNQTFPNVEFRFTEMSDHSKLYVSNKVADKEFISQASSLVYISGGYFGESHDEGFRGSVKRYMKYFNFGRKFVKKNKNIIISGVGAGPINRGFNRKLAVKIFNHAKIINVRDETSRKYMMSYGVKNIINETSD